MPPTHDEIELHERLVKMETLLEELVKKIEENEKRRVECDGAQTGKIDQILHNDKDKLERIATVEERVSNIKAMLYIFAVPLAGALARWFV